MSQKPRRVIGEDFDLLLKEKIVGSGIGIVITKKVAPRAVDRNRIKRLIRESAREVEGKLDGNIVMVVKKNFAGYKKEQVVSKINEIIAKLK